MANATADRAAAVSNANANDTDVEPDAKAAVRSAGALTERDVLRALAAGPQRRLDVGRSRLAYWSFGRGPDVVFVHGWPLHSATFRGLVPRLAGDFTCHLIDLPWAGQTASEPDAPAGLLEHTAALRAAVDLLGLGRYAFLAHDSGGVFARLVAARDERVAGVVLGNTEIPGYRSKLFELFVAVTGAPGGAALLRAGLRFGAVRRSALGFGGCFEDPRTVDGEFGDLFVRPLLESPETLEGQAKLLRNLDFDVVDRLPEAHGRLRAPALLVWGEADPFFPLSKARGMLSQFAGGAELRVIARAKLFAHEDHPDEFIAHARPFLLDCFAAAPAARREA